MIGFRFQIKREDGSKVTVKSSDQDLGMAALVELFEQFALGCGYTESTVSQYLKSET